MKFGVYRVWTIAGMLIFAVGILLFAKAGADIVSFTAGAIITTVNIVLLGKGVSGQIGHPHKRPAYILLLVLKYAFLLTTLYITIVIIRLNPIPFVAGITVLPLSSMVMAVFLMLRRQDDA
ncbi:MAG: hypothetical protein M1491_00715 [Deltaproteobacteria bacterium]|nr:hypothetical protein [Deltaproteobacteria bacterium]MCL5277342.1 hypothetical protein [Deltaproteobacteria bacterium]